MLVINMSGEDISHGIEACPITCHSPGNQLQYIFKYVKTNIPGPGINRDKFTEQFTGCACSGTCTIETCPCLRLFGDVYDDNGKLKNDGIQMLSSKPVLECGHACSCNPAYCANRIVQQGIKNTFCVYHTKNKGFGLMLDSRNKNVIPCLSFVCEYAGEVVGHEEAIKRIQETDATGQDNYLIAVKEHVSGTETCTYVDPRCIGNVGRFINHSCNPNLLMVPVRVNHQVPRLALFARKDIHPGEELTFDYSGSATMSVSSGAVTNIKRSVHSQVTTVPSTSETENPSINLCDTLIDNLTHLPESETDINFPIKRMKFHQTSCSANLTPLISNVKSESNRSMKNDINESKEENEVTEVVEMLNYSCATSKNMSNCSESTEANKTTVVKRKPCFCGSFNCTGFLPLDSNLLYD